MSARWEFRDDRLDMGRWIHARRSGYRAMLNPVNDTLTLSLFSRPKDGYLKAELRYDLTHAELQMTRLGWRWVVARALRIVRRELRNHRLNAL